MEFEDDNEAIKFLQSRGYILTKSWDWQKPKPDHNPTDAERAAAQYLFEEWDFGGIIF